MKESTQYETLVVNPMWMCQVEGEHELERVRRKKLEDAKRQIEAEADRKLADRCGARHECRHR